MDTLQWAKEGNWGPNVQNILRQSYRLYYDNAKVTIDLRQTSSLQNIS